MLSDPMDTDQSYLQFPCEFPIKVLGRAHPDFDVLVLEIVRRHAGDIQEGAMRTRSSRGGKYLSVTITIQALSRRQLDTIYQDLVSCEHVLMAL